MAQPPASSALAQTGVGTTGVASAFAVSTTAQVAPSTTSPATGNSPSTGVQQPSSPTPTPTPTPIPTPPQQQNGQSSDQPSISTIHSTTVVTKAATPTSTGTSTLIPVSTLSKPVAVTQVAQNGSTSVFTPSFVTVLTTSTNSDGSAITWTGVYANPTSDSSSQHQTFFQNTGAVAGVFAVLGIVVALVILCAVYLIRRSRRKRRHSGWQSPAASSDRYGSPTMRSISSEIPSEVSRSRMVFPTQGNSRGYLPVHVDIVQQTEHYPPEQGPSVEAPTHRPKMVSLTHNRFSGYSPSVPVPSEPLQEPRRWPPEGPFTDAPIPNLKRLSLMRDNGPNYLPKIPVPAEVGQVSRRLSIERQGEVSVSPTKMVFPTRDNATSKRPSILVPAETVRDPQSSMEVRNADPTKWKIRLGSLPPTQRWNSKAVEESSSSQSSPSVYPSSLPPIESEDESTTVGEQPAEPTMEVKKQAVTVLRPHSAGAPPRPPKSVLRSLSLKGPQSYYTVDSSTPSPSSSTTADSPPALLPRRTLLDVRPRSAPQGAPAPARSWSMYQ
ncbi:hypothetical protein JOM56_006034 [Amanita muscaria]